MIPLSIIICSLGESMFLDQMGWGRGGDCYARDVYGLAGVLVGDKQDIVVR